MAPARAGGGKSGHTYHERVREERTECDEEATEAAADVCYLDLFGHPRSGILVWRDKGWVVCRPIHLRGTDWTFDKVIYVNDHERSLGEDQ